LGHVDPARLPRRRPPLFVRWPPPHPRSHRGTGRHRRHPRARPSTDSGAAYRQSPQRRSRRLTTASSQGRLVAGVRGCRALASTGEPLFSGPRGARPEPCATPVVALATLIGLWLDYPPAAVSVPIANIGVRVCPSFRRRPKSGSSILARRTSLIR